MQYYKLFNSCRVVKGAVNSLIYDLERMDNSNIIPNSLYDILTQHPNKSIEEIKATNHNEYNEIIDEYFDFLIKNEYIFYCTKEEIEHFPTVDFKWESPKEITNSIIDFDGTILLPKYKYFIEELSSVGCEAIQFRSFVTISLIELRKLLSLFEETSITCVELVLPFSSQLVEKAIIELQGEFPRMRKVSIYKAPKNQFVQFITYSENDINPEKDCGKIERNFFSIGFETFAEAQCHNTCLNRKISVDRKGNIKGCPSMSHSYGIIEKHSIKEVLKQKQIQKYWIINKDNIEVCKDCEFRYCCTDCRVFIDNKKDVYSRPSKCNYNPYLGLWKGEDGYVDVLDWLPQKSNEHETA